MSGHFDQTGMSGITLMSNQEKTELIIFKPKHQLKVSDSIQLQVGVKTVHMVGTVKYLGMYPICNIGRIT